MADGDRHENKFVAEAAKAARKEVYEPVLKDLQGLKLLGDELPESVDPSYINWVPDHNAITANPTGFIDFLSERYNKKLQEQFATMMEKYQLGKAREEELLEDIARPQDEIDALRDIFGDQLKALEARANEQQFNALEDSIASLRAAARPLKDGGLFDETTRKQMLADAKAMEEAAGEPLKNIKLERRELKRRLSNLNKAQVVLEERLAKKLAKIERSEELSMGTLNRAARAGYKFLSEMENWTDEKLDAELAKLRTQFEQTAVRYDKSEGQVRKLLDPEENVSLKEIEKRAVAQGYTTVGFHGSTQVVNQFSGASTRLQRGVFFSSDPELASRFATGKATDGDSYYFPDEPEFLPWLRETAGDSVANTVEPKVTRYLELTKAKKLNKKQQKEFDELARELSDIGKEFTQLMPDAGGAPNVSKVRLKLGKTLNYKFEGRFNWDEEEIVIAKARAEGYDSVTFRIEDAKLGDETFYSILNDENIKFLDDPLTDNVMAGVQAELRRDNLSLKVSDFAERIADAEDLGREALRDMINDMLQESLANIQRINSRRAVRTEKLRAQAKVLDPAVFEERVSGIRAKRAERETDFNERIRVMGGDLDLKAGKADFTAYAREAATKTKDKFLGTNMRLPVVDMMQAERGAVLPRLLGFIPTREMAPWLERDIERVMRTHLRTMAPDIEITRKLGSVNGEEQWVKLTDELNKKLEDIKNAVDSKGKPRSAEWQQKETIRIQQEFNKVKFNLEGIIKRLRHQWGVPTNPDGAGYRMANTVMDLNVLRYMGGVTWASLPDVARPIMRNGLTRAFRDGFVPLVTNLKGLRMMAQEARQMGVGIDVLTNSRAQGILDITDDLQRGTKFERGTQYLAGRQGMVALFNYWTDAMKGLSANVSNIRILDSIGDVVNGTNSVKDATEFLASNGIDAAGAERIWAQIKAGGGAKVNGVWLPNTADWTDDIARRTFQQAVAREVNNTIVTPGVERPLWVNASTTGRMIAQFKSFAFSSTSKTLQAGLQQGDMAFATGVTISLALGALSYYVSSVVKGGESYERMMNADAEAWADEAYQRSGVTSVFGLGQDLLSRIPAVSPYVSLSGGRSTRRGGDDLIEAALGPSFDFATTSARILTGIDDPTKSTLHDARTLMPWQNTHLLGWIYSAIEEQANLKERR
jgi:hypothetical protein